MSIKLDSSKFKKIHSDKDHTVMEHEDGHTMKISHKALSAKMRAQIQKLPVHESKHKAKIHTDDSMQQGPVIGEFEAKERPYAEGGQVEETFGGEKKGTKSIGSIIHYPGTDSGEKKKKMADGGEVKKKKLEIEEIPQKKLEIEEIPQKKLDIEEIKPGEKYAEGGEALPVASSPEAIPPLPQEAINPNVAQSPQQSPQIQPQSTQNTPQLPTQQPSMSAQDSQNMPDLMEGYNKQVQGIRQEAQAQGQQAKEQTKALATQAQAVNNLMTDYQTHFNEIDQERKALVNDINKTHINPNRYLGSMDFGDKVSTAIGLALGGLGAGVNGGPNTALEFLNKQVDRDIESQERDLGKKQTLLSANMQRFGNLHDATAMTRLMQSDLIANKLKQAETRAASPLAKARAQQLLGQLEQQSAPLAQQLATRRMLDQINQQPGQQPGLSNLDPAQLVPSVVPEKHQEGVYKELERAQNTRQVAQTALDNFDRVTKEMNSMGGLGRLKTAAYSPAELQALEAELGTTVGDQEGTVRETAMHNVKNAYLPRVTDSPERLAERRQELAKYLKLKSSAPRAKSFGIDVDKFQSTNRSIPKTEIKTLNGIQYQKVQGGWKKIQ